MFEAYFGNNPGASAPLLSAHTIAHIRSISAALELLPVAANSGRCPSAPLYYKWHPCAPSDVFDYIAYLKVLLDYIAWRIAAPIMIRLVWIVHFWVGLV